MSLTKSALSFALALAAAVVFGAAQAQQPPQQRPMDRQATEPMKPQTQVDDREIQAYAAAANEVRQLKQKWIPRFQQAEKESPQAAAQVEEEAYTEMVGAVEKKGLSVDRYNEIYELAQVDPDVQRKVIEQLEQTRGGTSGGM
jgi:ribosomal protein L20